ncbi:TIGR03084 family metal-binding protein [Aeromicrobium sp. CTD01-1L150]|uniref:TIGR03084 family metal-binding protein n=1 Tax=Aeromicrobium sp. CTD01-1L150 TaxID=3341830 RepID=UPI0035C17E96
MTTLEDVLADLEAESAQLQDWVAPLEADRWATVTTPEGWTVAHQIGHLAWTDEASCAAIKQDPAFAAGMKAAAANPTGFVDEGAEQWAAKEPAALVQAWEAGRQRLAEALRAVPEGEKIAWFGPPMSPTSMATARIMETWAHGHDVAEALGITPPRSDRCRHVCHIGIRTRGFAYLVRGQEAPAVDVHVALTAPSGELWTWGPLDAPERVTGSGYDFALLATRRRHLDDVDVHAEGEHAAHWLTIVQAFAGLPGNDPLRLADR